METILQKLGLSINNKKTQFLICMNHQRRIPSIGSKEARERYKDKFQAQIADKTIVESDSLKTLGIHYDFELNFRRYWSEIKPIIWQ